MFNDAAYTVNIHTYNFPNLELTDSRKTELHDHQVAQKIFYGLSFFLWHNYFFCFRLFRMPVSSLLMWVFSRNPGQAARVIEFDWFARRYFAVGAGSGPAGAFSMFQSSPHGPVGGQLK
jgi:hypothetical protein